MATLDTLAVTASRAVHTGSSITTVTAGQFRGNVTDLPAVLEQVSGVAVRRTGGFGEYADASIRGSSPKQVQVYLDGIPLNSAAGGAVDLSKISLTSLRDVTVYKGTVPLELMGSTAGAVINLRSGSNRDIVTGLLEFGSFGYRKAGTMFRKNTGTMTHLFSVDYSGARNDYPFDDDNDTPYNSNDDAVKTKNHNAFTTVGVNYSNTWQLHSDHRLLSLVSFTDEQQELFRKELVDTTQIAEHSSEMVLGRLMWEYAPSGKTMMETRSEGRFKRGLFNDPLGQIHIGGPRKAQEDFPLAALHCDVTKTANDYLNFRALVRGGYEGYSSINFLASSTAAAPPSALRLTGAAAGECSLHRDGAGATLRYNHVYVSDNANFTPNHGSGKPLSQTWKDHFPNGNLDAFLNIRDWCIVDGALRYEYLPVSLSDRYGWGNNYLGNTDLLPERRIEGSIGCIMRHNRLESSLSIFSGATIDMIELVAQSQQILRAINNGDTRQAGIEWDLRGTPWPFLTIDNHLTVIRKVRLKEYPYGRKFVPFLFFSPVLKEYSVPLLFFSPVENDLRVTFSWNRSPFYKGYTAATDRVVPAPTCNAFISIAPLRRITLTYRCENYLNVTYTPVAYYTPLPGRMHFFIGKIQW